MPSSDSWGYYRLFMAAIEYKFDLYNKKGCVDGIKTIMKEIVEKSPSKQMAGSGLTDDFMWHSARLLCSGKWCEKAICPDNNRWRIFNCSGGTRPAKCKIWRDWRKQMRSYPDVKECLECHYFRTYCEGHTVKKAGDHACRCRKKVLPAHCPKAKAKR